MAQHLAVVLECGLRGVHADGGGRGLGDGDRLLDLLQRAVTLLGEGVRGGCEA